MANKVGEIKNNRLAFLNLTFEVDLDTNNIETDVNYDKRVLDTNRQEELAKYINDFVAKLVNLGVEEESNNGNTRGNK